MEADVIYIQAPCIYHVTADRQVIHRSYRQTADRAAGLAYYLRDQGLRRIGILAPNTPAFLEAIFGIAAAGAVNVAINYRLKPDDIAYIFQHAEVDAIIVDAEFVGLLTVFCEANPAVKIFVDTDTSDQSDGAYNQAVQSGLRINEHTGSRGWTGLAQTVANEDSLIALAYTSGTTARPKGVEYTHRGAYLAALANVVESGLNVDPRARYLCTLPSFHAMGWTFPWAVTAVRGTHYCLRRIDYSEIWRVLSTESITHFNAAPTVNTLLCSDGNAQRLQTPVRVTVAASPPSAYLFEKMESLNLLPVHTYGLTETYGPITKSYPMPEWADLASRDKFGKMSRQGHAIVTSEAVRVIRTDVSSDEVIDVARDGIEIGEIVFTGNLCTKGYYKDPSATAKLFAGGVLHTGDLAVRHPDGAVQIMDRAKDLIISGGENISSVALESILMTHPDILEVACVAMADEQWGERPKVFATIKSSSRSDAPTGEQIIAWARDHDGISRFMVPKEVEIIEELPKTSTGKLRKNILRDWAKGKARE